MSATEATARSPRFPVEVRRIPEEQRVRIAWDDGHASEYPFAYLHGWCPRAGCQGHGDEPRYLHAPNSVLSRIGAVGKYPLSVSWGDGHDTGIYSYRYLHQLRARSACRPR